MEYIRIIRNLREDADKTQAVNRSITAMLR